MVVEIINGQPWKQQYAFNETQSGDVTGWANTTALPAARMSGQAIVTQDRAFLLGGYVTPVVYTVPLNVDGTLGSWTTATELPIGIGESQAIITKNRIYLLGGYVTGGHYTASIYTAPINPDGTIGTWETAGALPTALGLHQVIVTKSRVYSLGGYNGGFLANVYTAPIDEDGLIGAWSADASLPGGTAGSQAVVTGGQVYLLGGFSPSGAIATVYTAPIDLDGIIGAWSTGTSLPGGRSHAQAVVVKGRVYLFGGKPVGDNHTAGVYMAPLGETGLIGTWTTGTSLASAKGDSAAIVTSSKVYLVGGSVSGSAVNNVQVASFAGGFNDYMDLAYTIPTFWTNFSGQTEILE